MKSGLRSCLIAHSAIDCRVTAYTQSSAIGCGLSALQNALVARRSGLRRNDYAGSDVDTWIGRVDAADALRWSGDQAVWESRNNALVQVGLAHDGFDQAVAAAIERFGAHRVGAVVGTSTSSIGRTEEAYACLENERMPADYRQPLVHNPGSPGLYVAHITGAAGPELTISTACASSAKVFATGWRWLQVGIVDAVVVGGVDSLCHSVIGGFSSLELTAPNQCRPFDRHREGISLGEAAGFALLMRAEHAPSAALRLAGYGESSDAFHMSQPPASGEGARRAMQAALGRGGIRAEQLGYINLHGTATSANDAAEAQALQSTVPPEVFASSTKAWTGHTLGAAGIIEAVIAMQVLHTGLLPGTLNLEEPDPELPFPIAREHAERAVDYALSNSFGFGGNNCSLVFARTG